MGWGFFFIWIIYRKKTDCYFYSCGRNLVCRPPTQTTLHRKTNSYDHHFFVYDENWCVFIYINFLFSENEKWDERHQTNDRFNCLFGNKQSDDNMALLCMKFWLCKTINIFNIFECSCYMQSQLKNTITSWRKNEFRLLTKTELTMEMK